MKQQRDSRLSPTVVGVALALLGFGAVLGLGTVGEVQAGPLVLSPSIASADRAGTGDYAVTRIGRGTPETKKCPRSNDGCETNLPPKPPAPQQ